jgi:hypothetical protein
MKNCGPSGEHCSKCHYAEIFIAEASNDWSITCHANPPKKGGGTFSAFELPVFYGYRNCPEDELIWCGQFKEKE